MLLAGLLFWPTPDVARSDVWQAIWFVRFKEIMFWGTIGFGAVCPWVTVPRHLSYSRSAQGAEILAVPRNNSELSCIHVRLMV
jgi:hypothetical protein